MGKPLDNAECDRARAFRAASGRGGATIRAGRVQASLPLADLMVALWLVLSVSAVVVMGMIRL